jgi:hypothetical protein
MKKFFALFLALAFIFLTACNTKPPVGTNADGSTISGNQTDSSNSGTSNGTTGKPSNGNTNSGDDYHWDWRETMQGQLVDNCSELIELPSRVVFQASINEDGMPLTYYYSKADGNAYVYCYDPLCDHTKYLCLGNPKMVNTGWFFSETVFVNNRFYLIDDHGKIYSFAFDGTDKKLEYDAGYLAYKSVWGVAIAYGPYIYILSTAEEKKHTLRYNTETKKMEDLTEKTGNFVYPRFFYNGMIYGQGDNSVIVDAFYKADLDLQSVEPIENISLDQHAGSILIGTATKQRESLEEYPEKIGISFYDMETGEQRIVTKEELGLKYDPIFVAATEEYFYFYESVGLYLGTAIFNLNGKEVERPIQKLNNGKLYRMNKDGTNIVCVYDNPNYELNRNVIIYDDKIVMQGRYMKVENKVQTIWGGAIQDATINPDGTIGEFVEVEILQ